jgi:CheY-like chemotaxis protein
MTKKILIVEDYKDAREFMKVLLEMSGYEVLEATDGYEAVEIVKQQAPGLILMDISLPSMDGLTATKIIRNFPEASHIPILAVTAHGEAFYQRAIDAGCDDLISKPLDFDILKPYLDQYLEQSV